MMEQSNRHGVTWWAFSGVVTSVVLACAGPGAAQAGGMTAAATHRSNGLSPGVQVESSAVAAAPSGAGAYVDNQVIVGYRLNSSAHDLSGVQRTARASHSRALGKRALLLDVGKGNVAASIQALRKDPSVAYAEPNYILHEAATTNDPSLPLEWGLSNTGQSVNGHKGKRGADISAPAAWDITTTTGSVVIGEVDSGIDYTHPDLAGNIWTNPGGIGGCPAGTHGYNVVAKSCAPMDDNKHGTFVAGVMGAVGNNGIGITGVAPTTRMLPVKFIHAQGWGTVAQLITGLDWIVTAKQAGVNVGVVNDSGTWTSWSYSQALKDELGKLASNAILFVTPSGNNKTDDDTTPRYPCNYGAPNEICVGATTQWDQLSAFSNYGVQSVDLAAPGTNIYSTLPGGGYGYWQGTSFSSAYVAAAAAMVLGRCPSLTTTELKSVIVDNVNPLTALQGKVASGGRLNVAKALQACGT
jgi:subtilisin family serine protease